MAQKKILTFNVFLDTDGQTSKNNFQNQKIEIDVLEYSGNYLVYKDVLRHRIQQKQGTSSTKTRGQVRGGGRKPWQQKGTGRARAGSTRSPLWRGGGIIFGPKPKKTKVKVNKKERRLALQTLFYNKRNLISVINNLEIIIKVPKTKKFLNICDNCKIDLNKKVLIIVEKKSNELLLSVKNVKNIELITASNLNTFDLLKAEQIILTPLAIDKIKEIYCD